MDHVEDIELLRQYLNEDSEPAFAELVQRHLPLVYRSALRQTGGDADLAKEISQRVFILAARKARSLLVHQTLVGWLHTTVYYTASEVKRADRRRRRYEQEASRMADLPSPNPSRDELNIQPVIDEALQTLEAKDRDAILLRFFENRPFAEIAKQLEIKEDAARMRVNRALLRLRELLASRGILSTEAVLSALLASEATAASATVPPALAAAIAHEAVTAIHAISKASVLIQIMSAKKAVIATTLISALAGVVSSSAFFHSRLQSTRSQNYRLQKENDDLRDKFIAENLANPKSTTPTQFASQVAAAADPQVRLDAIHAQVRLREVSRDALPSTVAHPLKFRGFDTPIRAVESFFWASYHADAETLAHSLYLDEAARAELEKIRTTLPPQTQEQYPTPESLLAMCIAYDAIGHPGPNSEDIFVDPPQPKFSGANDFSLPSGQSYHLTPDGWKFSFPARAIPAFVNNIVNPKSGS